ncbi:MAG: serine hydrolase domain-containing protein [Pseudomonadota bacterium]|jgi:CubicO group peptidase (beta-lactamase class C family)
MHRPIRAALLMLSLTLPATAAAQQPEVGRPALDAATLAPLAAKVGAQVDDAVDSRKAGGMGIALLVDGEVRWTRAAGWADRERRVPFTVDTPVHVGELSRLVLAALTLDLAAQGKLSLDDPIDRLAAVPPIRSRFPDARAITVRDLLTHHAGLPYSRLRGAYRKADAPVETLPDDAWYLAQPTGTVQLVSNLGYERLARALEVAGGAPLEAQLADRIRRPLSLTRLSWQPTDGTARAHREGKTTASMVAREQAALGLVASLADYARFAAALMPGALRAPSPLDTAARAEMTRVQNADVTFDVGNGAGLGWNLATSVRAGVGRVATLVGAFPEHRATLRIALDHGVGVLAVANWDEVDEVIFDLSADAFDALLEQRAGAAPRDRERPLPARIALPRGTGPAPPSALYATPAGLVIAGPRADGFELDFADLRFRANPRGDGWYRVRYDLLGVLPIGFSRLNRVAIAPVVLAGEPVLLGFGGDRYVLAGTALARDPGLFRYARFAGTYRLINPDVLSELAELDGAFLDYADGVLALGYEADFVVSVRPRLPLAEVAENLFVVAGRGANTGEEVRIDVTSDPPRITYSGYVLERSDD